MDFFGPVVRVVEIVVGIGILVFIHELGHFVAAKWAGVRVDKFALGMGPKIVGIVRGETEYSVRWVPLGGFVQMAGEEPGAETEAPRERQFRQQKPYKRAVILFAGSFMNFVLAIVFFAAAFGFGVMFTVPEVGYVEPGGIADKAGLRPGDMVVAVDGDREVDWEDVHIAIAVCSRGDNVTLDVTRDGKPVRVSVQPHAEKKGQLPTVGMDPAAGRKIEEIEPGSAAASAGLKVGDLIDNVDGRQFLYWLDFINYCSSRIGKPVAFAVTRDGKAETVAVTPAPAKRGTIGITPAKFPTVSKVFPGMPAEAAGIQKGDQILAVDNASTPCNHDIAARCAMKADQPLLFRILRDGRTFEVSMAPRQTGLTGPARTGIELITPSDWVVGAVQPGSPADKAGIRPGDALTRLGRLVLDNGTWDTVQAVLDASVKKGEVKIAWRSGSTGPEFPPAKVKVESAADPVLADVGVVVSAGQTHLRKFAPWRAPFVGLKKSWQIVQQVYIALKGIFTGDISINNFAGPVGIAGLSYHVTAAGLTKFIFWLAMLSANFAVFNLLPLTPFDGGLIVITGVEKLRGKATSDRVLMILMSAGWALVLVFFVFVTWNDILRFVR